MRRLQIVSIVLFAGTGAVFGLFLKQQMAAADSLSPLITIGERIKEVSVKDDVGVLLEDVQAEDTKDGDVSDSLVVEGISGFLEEGRRRVVSYAAFDGDHHVSRAKREIVYTDYVPPHFSIEEPLSFPVGTTELLSALRAEDCLDGDVTDQIKISAYTSVTVDAPGAYPVTFQVANSAGDVAYLPVTVEFYETGSAYQTPKISLTKYLIYVKKGKKRKAETFLDTVTLGGKVYSVVSEGGTYGEEEVEDEKPETIDSSWIQITDTVDYKKAGTYEILYRMTTPDGITGSTRLIVVVEERGEEGDDAERKGE